MAWSKVKTDTKKPFKWWCYKIMCEFGWLLYGVNNGKIAFLGMTMYYKYLNKMIQEFEINLYGEVFKSNK